MNTKFIDGKKVEVVSELNSSQTIVREIYVDESGNELPHGESFTVVTSKLSDSPLSSWQSKELPKYKEEYNQLCKDMELKIYQKKRELQTQYNRVYNLTKSVQGMACSLGADASMSFIRLLDFIAGRINWVVVCSYRSPEIFTINDFFQKYMYHSDYDGRAGEGLKMVTLYGSLDRDGKVRGLNYRLNNYGDGSGSSSDIYIFHEEHEAIEKVKEILLSYKHVSESIIEKANKYGIELDSDLLEKFYSEKKENIKKQLAEKKLEIDKKLEELIKLENQLNK
jgi:hypothetical protein